jgi:hypothetical protein
MQRRTVLVFCLLLTACGGSSNYIKGTKIPRTEDNREVVDRIEAYRLAVEEQDAAALLLMASKNYWEDSGTPTGEDDYGYDGLKEVLAGRFQKADSIRYAMRYMKIRYSRVDEDKPKAFVDVLVDASFTVPDARGQLRRTDKRDQNQFVLEWDGETWMFLSGM